MESSGESQYEVVKAAVSWEEASARCEAMGGHLATITSAAEMDQLSQIASDAGLTYVWIGGYTSIDPLTQEIYGHWVTAEPFDYEHWSTGEPSHVDKSDGVDERYLMLWNIPSLGGWSWNDQRNNPLDIAPKMADAMGYICEYDG